MVRRNPDASFIMLNLFTIISIILKKRFCGYFLPTRKTYVG